MTSTSTLLVALDQGIKRITFNRPGRRNAVDAGTIDQLLFALRESATDGTRVIVLAGKGDAFCAGADLQAMPPDQAQRLDVTETLRASTNPAVLALRELPVPVIASVRGPAAGVGCNFALACDVVIAGESAVFSQAFVRIGLAPDGGSTYILPRLVGRLKAFELMVTGDPVSATDAHALGLVTRVVPDAALDGVTNEWASRLARGPALAIARIKAALAHGERSDLAGALDFEAVQQADCLRSPDFAEGVRAFLEKRPPHFA